MLRKLCILVLFGLTGLVSDVAEAGGPYGYSGWGPYGPGYRAALRWGWRVSAYGYSLDDSFDPPIGYGEYAEYGPWAYGACFPTQRRVVTSHGWRLRWVQVCH